MFNLKKLFCLVLIVIFCLTFVGCEDNNQKNTIELPLKEINAVYDIHGNLLQQTVYNEQTDEYVITIFTYSHETGTWTCIDQKTIITNCQKDPVESTTDNSLTIYYNNDLKSGPLVLIDNSDIKISIVEYLKQASWWEFGYKLKVENKSTKVLTYMFDYVSIVGIECKPMFTIDHIEPGHTDYFNLAWDKESLERAYIPYLDNIEFMLRVYDNDDWKDLALYGTRALIKE